MEVNIGTKVQKNKKADVHKSKLQSKKTGNAASKRKYVPRIIPFPVEEVLETNNPVIDWSSPGKPFASKKKKDNRPFMHLFISLAGALLVGTVMGFSVLTLFFSDHPNANSNSIDAHLPAHSAKTTPAAKKSSEPKPVVPRQAIMDVPVLQVSLLQAGNYQSKSSATSVADQYRTKGFAAVMSDQAPFRIYLGVAGSKAGAEQLTKRYAAKGIKVYVKQQTLAGKGAALPNLPATLKIGNTLFDQLQSISVASIANKGKMEIPSNLKQQQIAFMKANQSSLAYPTEIRAAMMELARGLDQAVQGAAELSKHPNAALAWTVQEGLVHYTAGYEHLIYSLNRNK